VKAITLKDAKGRELRLITERFFMASECQHTMMDLMHEATVMFRAITDKQLTTDH
jgi:hypothetical protein